jgi:hypothetical protein
MGTRRKRQDIARSVRHPSATPGLRGDEVGFSALLSHGQVSCHGLFANDPWIRIARFATLQPGIFQQRAIERRVIRGNNISSRCEVAEPLGRFDLSLQHLNRTGWFHPVHCEVRLAVVLHRYKSGNRTSSVTQETYRPFSSGVNSRAKVSGSAATPSASSVPRGRTPAPWDSGSRLSGPNGAPSPSHT